MMSKNSIVPFLKDYLIKFLTRPFLLDTNVYNFIYLNLDPRLMGKILSSVICKMCKFF